MFDINIAIHSIYFMYLMIGILAVFGGLVLGIRGRGLLRKIIAVIVILAGLGLIIYSLYIFFVWMGYLAPLF